MPTTDDVLSDKEIGDEPGQGHSSRLKNMVFKAVKANADVPRSYCRRRNPTKYSSLMKLSTELATEIMEAELDLLRRVTTCELESLRLPESW